MFSEGWGSPEGPQIGPKIEFRRSMRPFRVPLECYYFKVGFKSGFLEKVADRAEQFWGARPHQGDLS